MNNNDNYEINEQTLADLRLQEDAIRLIGEKLRLKEMGPADHIRTKHEIKAYVDSGSNEAAHLLIQNSAKRRSEAEAQSEKQGYQRSRNMEQ